MSEPASIRIFLLKGDPKLLRTAEISNWSGKAIACSRTEIGELLKRDEASKPGVYLLAGSHPSSGQRAIYIGEAEELTKRLKQHLDKDYWTHAYVFFSKDENLTKAHVRHLEGALIAEALRLGKVEIMNATGSGSRLSEAETADMGVFFRNVRMLLAVLGVDAFEPVESKATARAPLLFCRIKGLEAKGRRTPGGFVVYKGSDAVRDHRPSAGWSRRKREELISRGDLILKGDHYAFARDIEFPSPSTAGAVVRGGTTNGPKAWRTGEGVTLKQLDQKDVQGGL